MKRTISESNHLHALIGILGISKEEKADLVHSTTKGRSQSSADLYRTECQDLINFLKAQVDQQSNVKDQQRKKVIAQMKQAGYILESGKADMDSIKKWIKTMFKKEFNSLSTKELSKAIVASEKVKQHYFEKL